MGSLRQRRSRPLFGGTTAFIDQYYETRGGDAAVISLGDQVPQYYRHRGFFNDGSLLATKIVERGSRMIVFQLRLIPDRDGFSVEYTDVPGLFRGTCSSRH